VLTVLSKLLAVAEEQRAMEQAPRVRLFAKLPKPPFDFLTFEEAERLSNAAEPEWRALMCAPVSCSVGPLSALERLLRVVTKEVAP
jgi:hypothetical protein